MATTFKAFLNNDITTTRTMLHERVPITGSILARTYGSADTAETNIKTYGHNMFVSVYDYPYLSSSSNHLMDITFGTHPDWDGYQAAGANGIPADFSTAAGQAQFTLRKNIYSQMQQILVGVDQSGNRRKFDRDGNFSDTVDDMYHNCVFISLSRLLTKDEIKKGTFAMEIGVGQHALSADYTTTSGGALNDVTEGIFEPSNGQGGTVLVSDLGAADEYRVNSPAGEYAILYLQETDGPDDAAETDTDALHADADAVAPIKVGLIYYQAGIVVLNMDWMADLTIADEVPNDNNGPEDDGVLNAFAADYLNWYWDSTQAPGSEVKTWFEMMKSEYNIDNLSEGLRHRINKISFNNTTELNSTIYFCRANHNEFNYSSNPSYLNGSKIVVKENTNDEPVSFVTSVGLYSPDNELLAVAKLSEPLKKTPDNELTLRVRLDY